jgi:hypothetical protein
VINKPTTVKFYGSMDWFDVDDDFDDVVFPPSFNEAKRLWSEDIEKNADQVLKLIEPFVRAWFVPAGLPSSEEIFPDQSDCKATKIRVVGIDFSATPFPLCKAEAWFEVPVSDSFATTDLEEWQDDTGDYFYQAISFGWEIPSEDGDDPLIFTYGNNQGVECVPNVTF